MLERDEERRGRHCEKGYSINANDQDGWLSR